MSSGIRSANALHRVKFRQHRSNGCGDIAILQFSKMAVAAILDFQKFKFLTAITFERPNLRYGDKFHQIGKPVAEIWRIFDFSRWPLSAMLDFYNCDFKCSPAQRVPMRTTMSNFVKISQMVAECQCASGCQISSKSVKFLQRYCDFSFPKCRPPPSWIFKNSNS